MRSMILIRKMVKEHVRDFSIKLRDFVKYLKPIALLETTESSFLKPTRSYTRREASVTWQKYSTQLKKVSLTYG